jgi:signal transduction histidine kinase
MPQCVCLYSAEGRCLLANDRLCRWLGRTLAQVVDQTIDDLWPAEVAAQEHADLRLVLERGRIEQREWRPGSSGGRMVHAVKYPWRGPDGNVLAVAVVFEEAPLPFDSTTRYETVGRSALGIVHDFNNTLMLLEGHIAQLESLGRDVEAVAGARLAVDHAAALPRQLLSLVREEPPRRESVDVNVLVANLPLLLQGRLAERITVQCDLTTEDARVEGDPIELRRALLNLATNAVQAMTSGGVLTLETSVVWLDRPGGRFVTVTVRDTGPGIPARIASHLFETPCTTRCQGTGLGLSVVQAVVQEHGGWIGWQSEPGQGAAFVLHLPAQATARATGAARASRVIVIETDEAIRRLACTVLEREGGFQVVSCASVREACAVALTHGENIDLVLIDADLCLPAEWSDLLEVLALTAGASWVVTGNGAAVSLPASLREQIRAVAPKPYGADLLLRTVRSLLCSPEGR